MRKRILTLLLTCIIITCTLNTNSYAYAPAVITNEDTSRPVNDSDVLIFYKQYLRDLLVEYVENQLRDSSLYSEEIWALFKVPIDDIDNKINTLPESDLYTMRIITEITSEITYLSELASYISTCTSEVYKTEAELVQKFLPKVKEGIDSAEKEFFEVTGRDEYSEYYLSIFDDKLNYFKNKYKSFSSSTKMRELIEFELDLYYYFDIYVDNPFYQYSYDTGFILESVRTSLDAKLKDFLKINKRAVKLYKDKRPTASNDELNAIYSYAEYNWIYTEDDLDDEKEYQINRVNIFVDRAVAKSQNVDAATLSNIKKEREGVINKINSAYDVDVAAGHGESFIAALCAKYNVSYTKLSEEKISYYETELEKLDRSYDRKLYSSERSAEMDDLFVASMDFVNSAYYESDIPDDYLTQVKAEYDKVPLMKAELKTLKKKYIKKLKAYAKGNNKSKYNQKKVKKIIKKGTLAMKKAKDVDKLNSIYEKWNNKAKKTINKYKVTVVCHGGGEASESKTVSHGEKFMLDITPDAGYKISKVTFNGSNKKLKNSYTIKVKRKYKIHIYFSK